MPLIVIIFRVKSIRRCLLKFIVLVGVYSLVRKTGGGD